MDRPNGCRFWDHTDILKWIRANVDLRESESKGDPAADAALWWKACLDAEQMRDLSMREMAEFCLDGMEPTTMQSVTDEIQAPHLDMEPYENTTIEELDGHIEQSLRDHFMHN